MVTRDPTTTRVLKTKHVSCLGTHDEETVGLVLPHYHQEGEGGMVLNGASAC